MKRPVNRDAYRREGGNMIQVSCLMPTFGRFPAAGFLVAEAVECFARQDYAADERELIILNDTPGQELYLSRCPANVHVYNVDRRFPSLSAKYNALVALARGRYLMPWEDDDLSLPWRLGVSVAAAGGLGLWSPQRTIVQMHGEPWRYETNVVGMNMATFRRALWSMAGGFAGQSEWDQRFMSAARTAASALCCVAAPIARGAVFYVYRWGAGSTHLSALPPGQEGYELLPARLAPVPGRYEVVPFWRHDYVAEARRLALGAGA